MDDPRRAAQKELLDVTRYGSPDDPFLHEMLKLIAHHGVKLAIEFARPQNNFTAARISRAQSELRSAVHAYMQEWERKGPPKR
jgi:hypothetical protein